MTKKDCLINLFLLDFKKIELENKQEYYFPKEKLFHTVYIKGNIEVKFYYYSKKLTNNFTVKYVGAINDVGFSTYTSMINNILMQLELAND